MHSLVFVVSVQCVLCCVLIQQRNGIGGGGGSEKYRTKNETKKCLLITITHTHFTQHAQTMLWTDGQSNGRKWNGMARRPRELIVFGAAGWLAGWLADRGLGPEG